MQAFRDNLRYVRNEPELVFERLIGSVPSPPPARLRDSLTLQLNHGFEITANQHHTVVDVLCAENKRLLESARQLRAEPTQSHANRQPEPPPGESAVQASHVVNSVVDLRVGPTAQNADSVRLVCKFIATAKEVHVLCKTSTVACPIPLAGCTWADIGHVDPTFQSGQTTFSSGILGQMVTFATPFLKDAEVLAWLTHIDYRGEVPVKAACEDISTTGFRLNLTIFYWDEGDASFMWKMAVTPKEAEVY